MNIYDALKQDHQKVRDILQELQDSSDGGKNPEKLLSTLKQELEIHSTFEEEVFYPAVAERQEAKEEIADAIDEHDEAMSLLEELEDMDSASPEWAEQVKTLSDAINHHVEEEESEIFEMARETIDQQRATQMAKEYQQQKQERMKQSA